MCDLCVTTLDRASGVTLFDAFVQRGTHWFCLRDSHSSRCLPLPVSDEKAENYAKAKNKSTLRFNLVLNVGLIPWLVVLQFLKATKGESRLTDIVLQGFCNLLCVFTALNLIHFNDVQNHCIQRSNNSDACYTFCPLECSAEATSLLLMEVLCFRFVCFLGHMNLQ